jgi:hypothetical protein
MRKFTLCKFLCRTLLAAVFLLTIIPSPSFSGAPGLTTGDRILIEYQDRAIFIMLEKRNRFISTAENFRYGRFEKSDSEIVMRPLGKTCRLIDGKPTLCYKPLLSMVLTYGNSPDSLRCAIRGYYDMEERVAVKKMAIGSQAPQGLWVMPGREQEKCVLLAGDRDLYSFDDRSVKKVSYKKVSDRVITMMDGKNSEKVDLFLMGFRKASGKLFDSLYRAQAECPPFVDHDKKTLIDLLEVKDVSAEDGFLLLSRALGRNNFSIVDPSLLDLFDALPDIPKNQWSNIVNELFDDDLKADGLSLSDNEGLKRKLAAYGVTVDPKRDVHPVNLCIAWLLEKTTPEKKKKKELYRLILKTVLCGAMVDK